MCCYSLKAARKAPASIRRTPRADVAELLPPLYVARATPKNNRNDGAICLAAMWYSVRIGGMKRTVIARPVPRMVQWIGRATRLRDRLDMAVLKV